jgi:hypothetical protein
MNKTVLDTKALSGFESALTEMINGVSCEFYKGNGFDGVITREKLGAALAYTNPRDSIAKIHRRHAERFDTRSGIASLSTPGGGTQQTVIYSLEGALEVCRWSRSPVADAVMDTLYAVFKKLITVGSASIDDLPLILSETIAKNPEFAYENIVPALKNRQLNQRKLLGDIVGVMGCTASGSDIEKQFEINSIGANMLRIWEIHGDLVYTIDNLPEQITSDGDTMCTILKWSKQPKNLTHMVNYCGFIYFVRNGMINILDLGIKNKLIIKKDAENWLMQYEN